MAQGSNQASVVKLPLPDGMGKGSVVANDEGETGASEVFPLVIFCASINISYLSGMRFFWFLFFFFLIQDE